MNSNLLKAIRLTKKRLMPAIEKQRHNNPIKEKFLQYIRMVSPLREIPIKVNSRYRLFLDGSIIVNTKTGAAYQELLAAGYNEDKIWHNSLETKSSFNKLFRTGYRFIWFAGLLLKQHKAFRTLDLVSLQVFVGYEAYKRFFKKHEQLMPIIISDITPTAQMLWAATASLNRDVLWWQDDYHHYKGFSKENYLPFACTHAAVLNQKGLETVFEKNIKTIIFLRNQTKVKPIRPLPEHPKVGIATNAFFEATQVQIDLLFKIKEKLNVAMFKLRLHPNSQLTATSFPKGLVEIASSVETLTDFANSIDLAIVGNSAVQLKFLCEGLPVFHISGLDNHKYDFYKYCNDGFCFGTEDPIDFELETVKEFYLKASSIEKLRDYVNVKNLEISRPLSMVPELDYN